MTHARTDRRVTPHMPRHPGHSVKIVITMTWPAGAHATGGVGGSRGWRSSPLEYLEQSPSAARPRPEARLKHCTPAASASVTVCVHRKMKHLVPATGRGRVCPVPGLPCPPTLYTCRYLCKYVLYVCTVCMHIHMCSGLSSLLKLLQTFRSIHPQPGT